MRKRPHKDDVGSHPFATLYFLLKWTKFCETFFGLLEMNGIDVEEEEDLTDNEDCVEATEVVTEAEVDAISLCQINLIKEISIQWARNSKIITNDLLSTKSSLG